MATLKDVGDKLDILLREIEYLPQRIKIAGNQINVVNLSEVTEQLGLIRAGEFRSGNEKDPGFGFSGVRIGYPPFTYSSETWNIVGIENDVLQFGVRASDGKLIAGGGDVIIDVNGITFEWQQAALIFKDSTGSLTNILIYSDSLDNLVLTNKVGGSSTGIRFDIDTVSNDVINFFFVEDIDLANRSRAIINAGTYGARLDVGTGVQAFSRGSSGGNNYLLLEDDYQDTPPDPDNDSAVAQTHLYIRSQKLIAQYNDGGTVRYKYLDLTGTGTTWTHTTTPP